MNTKLMAKLQTKKVQVGMWLVAIAVMLHLPGALSWLTAGQEAGGVLAWGGEPSVVIGNLLIFVLGLMGYISMIGLSIVAYTLRPEVVATILAGGEGEIVYVMWTMVRDVLNLVFILVLLFSAFATIFQVEKYNLRSILLRLVLMAIFVNFSLPIARIIIDASNIIMFYFINILFQSATTTSVVADAATHIGISVIQSMNIADLLVPDTATSTDTILFFSVIFTLIFGVLTIAIGAILVVRLVALTILMIFSPIAFVANILPSTQKFASDWWNNLFKYALVGPSLIFFLFFSTVFMAQLNDMAFLKDNSASMAESTTIIKTTKNIASEEQSYLGTLAFGMIPIIILYMGIVSSLKMGGAAGTAIAGTATGALSKIRRGVQKGAWKGTKFAIGSTAGAIDRATGHRISGVAAVPKMKWDQRQKRLAQEKADAHGRIAATATRDPSKRAALQTKQFGKEVADAAKELEYLSNIDLERKLGNGTHAEKAASAKMLADRGALNSPAKLTAAIEAVGYDRKAVKVHDDIENSLKKNNQRGTLAQHHATGGKHFDQETGKWKAMSEAEAINKYLNLSAGKLAQQDLRSVRGAAVTHLNGIIKVRVTNDKAVTDVYKSDNTKSIEYIKLIQQVKAAIGNAPKLDWA